MRKISTQNNNISIDKKIAEIRSRLQFGHVDSGDIEATMRLLALHKELIKFNGGSSDEMLRYFPVAAIATLESHFRITVTTIVSEGDIYLERALKLLGDKIKTSDVLLMIHNRSLTIGDLLGYTLSFSSISHLVDVYSSLLDTDFKKFALTAQDPYLSRIQGPDAKLIVKDVSLLWRDLTEAFEARHIIAHESASQYQFNYAQAAKAVDSVKLMINLVDSLLWSTIWKNKPLTQREMNDSAFEKYKSIRQELAKEIKVCRLRYADKYDRVTFNRLHLKWKKWSLEWCDFNADRFEGGSVRPLIYYDCMYDLFRHRISQVQELMPY